MIRAVLLRAILPLLASTTLALASVITCPTTLILNAPQNDQNGVRMAPSEVKCALSYTDSSGPHVEACTGNWESSEQFTVAGAQALRVDCPECKPVVEYTAPLGVQSLEDFKSATIGGNFLILGGSKSFNTGSSGPTGAKTFVRTGSASSPTWTPYTLDSPSVAYHASVYVRSVGFHNSMMFAGTDPYSGDSTAAAIWSATVSGGVPTWGSTPEAVIPLGSLSYIPAGTIPRVMRFVECPAGGTLFASIATTVFSRNDSTGAWSTFATISGTGYSQSGLRGLSCVPKTDGSANWVLLASVETLGNIYSIDPSTAAISLELNMKTFIAGQLGITTDNLGSQVDAYNDIPLMPDGSYAVGMHITFTYPPPSGVCYYYPPGTLIPSVCQPYFLTRTVAPLSYTLNKLPAIANQSGWPEDGLRQLAISPFVNDSLALYAVGYDSWDNASYTTFPGWMYRIGP